MKISFLPRSKALFLFFWVAATVTSHAQQGGSFYYRERFRPQFHFTPQKNWMNDPNGLIYFNGEYHLYYQHNPFGNLWGHMSWGHATSRDLLHWKSHPLALREEEGRMAFSGSVVADPLNRSGFAQRKGETPLVAVYTRHDSLLQNQVLGVSIDQGKSFQNYSGNPVLDLNMKDFRDPNVFWHEKTKQFVMAVAMPNEKIVSFYTSFSLKQWTFQSDFGAIGDTSGVWECPDLVEVPVQGEPGKTKWVLLVSVGNAMQYFVGNFDGYKFYLENPEKKIFRPDNGPDYYAAVTYKGLPEGPVSLGWVNNWSYANAIPTNPWKGAMSLPRQLQVKQMGKEWVLVQQPVKALRTLRSTAQVLHQPIRVKTSHTLPFRGQQYELELDLEPAVNSISGLRIAVGGGRAFTIRYDATLEQLYIDRSTTPSGFSKQYPFWAQKNAYAKLYNNKLHLQVFFDQSIVEVFANNGELVFTSQIFPEKGDVGIQLFSDGNETAFSNIWFWPMKSIWNGDKNK